jgi:hypothetical protein
MLAHPSEDRAVIPALVALTFAPVPAPADTVRVALPLSAPVAAGFAAPGSSLDVVFPAEDPKARVALAGVKLLAVDAATANGKTTYTATVELTAKQAATVAPLLRAKAEPLVWARELAVPKGAKGAEVPKGYALLGLLQNVDAGAVAFVAPGSRVDLLATDGKRAKVAFESLLVFAVSVEGKSATLALVVPLADAESAAALFRKPDALAVVLKKPDGK